MRVELIKPCDSPEGIRPAGTIIDHADAGRLLELGLAKPACSAAAEHQLLIDAKRAKANLEAAEQQAAEDKARAEANRQQFMTTLGIAVSDAPPPAEAPAEESREAAKPRRKPS